jgi:hypothetical protein
MRDSSQAGTVTGSLLEGSELIEPRCMLAAGAPRFILVNGTSRQMGSCGGEARLLSELCTVIIAGVAMAWMCYENGVLAVFAQ